VVRVQAFKMWGVYALDAHCYKWSKCYPIMHTRIHLYLTPECLYLTQKCLLLAPQAYAVFFNVCFHACRLKASTALSFKASDFQTCRWFSLLAQEIINHSHNLPPVSFLSPDFLLNEVPKWGWNVLVIRPILQANSPDFSHQISAPLQTVSVPCHSSPLSASM